MQALAISYNYFIFQVLNQVTSDPIRVKNGNAVENRNTNQPCYFFPSEMKLDGLDYLPTCMVINVFFFKFHTASEHALIKKGLSDSIDASYVNVRWYSKCSLSILRLYTTPHKNCGSIVCSASIT